MAVKNAVAKSWGIVESSDGLLWSAYPAGDKPGSAVEITTVTGTVSTGNALTITGVKLWDQLTTNWDPFFTASAAGFEGANPAANGYTASSGDQTYDSSVKLMGSQSMKCVDSGATSVGSKGGSSFTYIVDISNAQTNTDAYWRSYVRWNTNEWPDTDIKFWWLGGGAKNVFVNLNPNGGAAPTQIGFLATDYNGGSFNWYNIPGGAIQNNVWYLIELHVMKVGAASPVVELWMDNQPLASVSSVSGVSPNPGGWGFETNTNWWSTTAGFNYTQYQDGFVINTASRVGPASLVEIGNSSVYASASPVYQRPTTISDTSVIVTCDLTGLGAGPYWMWVTNSQGVRSAAKAL